MYKEIKVVCFDIDGTLTDGIYQISSSGEVSKSFYTRDFYAIEQLLRVGLKVIIITQSHDDVMHKQLLRICDHSDFWTKKMATSELLLWTAVRNKADKIKEMFRPGDMGWENIAYVGDAENDLLCMQCAGFSGCPNDAISSVKEAALHPSDYNGGHGAVHDFCMSFLKKINEEI